MGVNPSIAIVYLYLKRNSVNNLNRAFCNYGYLPWHEPNPQNIARWMRQLQNNANVDGLAGVATFLLRVESAEIPQKVLEEVMWQLVRDNDQVLLQLLQDFLQSKQSHAFGTSRDILMRCLPLPQESDDRNTYALREWGSWGSDDQLERCGFAQNAQPNHTYDAAFMSDVEHVVYEGAYPPWLAPTPDSVAKWVDILRYAGRQGAEGMSQFFFLRVESGEMPPFLLEKILDALAANQEYSLLKQLQDCLVGRPYRVPSLSKLGAKLDRLLARP